MDNKWHIRSSWALLAAYSVHVAGCYRLHADMSKTEILRIATVEFPKGASVERITRRCEQLDIRTTRPEIEKLSDSATIKVMRGHLPARARIFPFEWVVPVAKIRFMFDDADALIGLGITRGVVGP